VSEGVLLDTNILIYHLNDSLPTGVREQVEATIRVGATISVITRIEVLSWATYSAGGGNDDSALSLLGVLREEALTEEIASRTIAIRRAARLKLPDALIAATALTLDLPLMTRNADDFRRVEGLRIINPFEAEG
jgi:toxin FitB